MKLKEQNVEKLKVNEIAPSMVLASDVFTKDGYLLFPKDIMLTENTYRQLIKNNITEVFVKIFSIEDNVKSSSQKESDTIQKKPIVITERKEFKKFATVYEDNTEKAKNIILDISNGGTIEVDELYALTDKMVNSLKCKNDVLSFINFMKGDDDSTFNHSSNVAMLCNLFSRWLDLPEEIAVHLTTAGMLHDIGKTKINKEILNKTGKLTDFEFAEMKKHTVYGYQIIQADKNIPAEVKLAALMHHEKMDGTGYPTASNRERINEYSKIVSICDIYDAMTANRVYRKKLDPFHVIKDFERNSYGQLDIKYLLVFLKNIAYHYIGAWVKLDDEIEGEVIFIDEKELSRPLIRTKNNIIDLRKNKKLNILEVL